MHRPSASKQASALTRLPGFCLTLFGRYSVHPVLVIIDVQTNESGIPTKAYIAVEQGKEVRKIPSRHPNTLLWM